MKAYKASDNIQICLTEETLSDEFFDDEEELMASELEAVNSAKKPEATEQKIVRKEKREPLRTASGRVAPPFWMVLLIAILALVLGIVIGYLLGSSSALSALESQQEELQTEASQSQSFEMPEGHPQVSVDENGKAYVEDDGTASSSSSTSSSDASTSTGE